MEVVLIESTNFQLNKFKRVLYAVLIIVNNSMIYLKITKTA
jgi:hypothetical protein